MGYEFSTCEKVPWSLKFSVYPKIGFGNESLHTFIFLVLGFCCSPEDCLYTGDGKTFRLLLTDSPFCETVKAKVFLGPGPTVELFFMCSICETLRQKLRLRFATASYPTAGRKGCCGT